MSGYRCEVCGVVIRSNHVGHLGSHRCNPRTLARIDAANRAAGDAELDPEIELVGDSKLSEADRLEEGFSRVEWAENFDSEI